MLRHVYAVIEYYEDHTGYSEELKEVFSNPVNANQFVKLNYEVESFKYKSNVTVYNITDSPYITVEVRLIKLDPNVRG